MKPLKAIFDLWILEMEEELQTLREFERKTLEEEAKAKEAEEQRKARENEKHKRWIFWVVLFVKYDI